jgi:hypothetical protein
LLRVLAEPAIHSWLPEVAPLATSANRDISNITTNPVRINGKMRAEVMPQLQMKKYVIAAKSCFNPALGLIVTGCFQHDRLVVQQ